MRIADIFDRFRRPAGPRPVLRVAAHTPLERLPMVVVDSETTGLDPRRDRIVSIAAIAIEPGLVVGRPLLDLLIDPRITIPARSTAVHGIDGARLAGAPTLPEAWPEISSALAGRVMVGHHLRFDLAMLAAEARRARRPWREPPHLDTAALSAGLGVTVDGLDLTDILAKLGLEARGTRHTALGDALMTADLFVALARRLRGLGRATFSGAIASQRL